MGHGVRLFEKIYRRLPCPLRRRPKMQRAVLSWYLLNELGRFVIAARKAAHLPHESLEILKGIDALDAPANVPSNISPELWANLCRLRRQRIESELKVRLARAVLRTLRDYIHLNWKEKFPDCFFWLSWSAFFVTKEIGTSMEDSTSSESWVLRRPVSRARETHFFSYYHFDCVSCDLTNYRPAMPIVNWKIYQTGSFQFSIVAI